MFIELVWASSIFDPPKLCHIARRMMVQSALPRSAPSSVFTNWLKDQPRIDVVMVRSDKGEEAATCPSNRTFDLRIFCVDTAHSTYLIDGQFSRHLIFALNHCGSDGPYNSPVTIMIFQAIRPLNPFLPP
jgi:hypothetical protein